MDRWTGGQVDRRRPSCCGAMNGVAWRAASPHPVIAEPAAHLATTAETARVRVREAAGRAGSRQTAVCSEWFPKAGPRAIRSRAACR